MAVVKQYSVDDRSEDGSRTVQIGHTKIGFEDYRRLIRDIQRAITPRLVTTENLDKRITRLDQVIESMYRQERVEARKQTHVKLWQKKRQNSEPGMSLYERMMANRDKRGQGSGEGDEPAAIDKDGEELKGDEETHNEQKEEPPGSKKDEDAKSEKKKKTKKPKNAKSESFEDTNITAISYNKVDPDQTGENDNTVEKVTDEKEDRKKEVKTAKEKTKKSKKKEEDISESKTESKAVDSKTETKVDDTHTPRVVETKTETRVNEIIVAPIASTIVESTPRESKPKVDTEPKEDNVNKAHMENKEKKHSEVKKKDKKRAPKEVFFDNEGPPESDTKVDTGLTNGKKNKRDKKEIFVDNEPPPESNAKIDTGLKKSKKKDKTKTEKPKKEKSPKVKPEKSKPQPEEPKPKQEIEPPPAVKPKDSSHGDRAKTIAELDKMADMQLENILSGNNAPVTNTVGAEKLNELKAEVNKFLTG